ncbi:hypothetical protein [Schlesneria paludicola]|uniref:hypothetical protein n=1 Tax=Schlesneria paludicola TaxID=360056 RepID=UPI00029AE9A4|nr:hypothetical protein [Schlesneria paludicola]
MQIISADKILAAIRGGNLEAIGDDGVIMLLLNGKAFLTVSEAPTPRISKGADHAITILSGDVPLARIESESDDDAEKIASILADLLIVV